MTSHQSQLIIDLSRDRRFCVTQLDGVLFNDKTILKRLSVLDRDICYFFVTLWNILRLFFFFFCHFLQKQMFASFAFFFFCFFCHNLWTSVLWKINIHEAKNGQKWSYNFHLSVSFISNQSVLQHGTVIVIPYKFCNIFDHWVLRVGGTPWMCQKGVYQQHFREFAWRATYCRHNSSLHKKC